MNPKDELNQYRFKRVLDYNNTYSWAEPRYKVFSKIAKTIALTIMSIMAVVCVMVMAIALIIGV